MGKATQIPDFLVCPLDGAALKATGSGLQGTCGHRFPVTSSGVIDLLSRTQLDARAAHEIDVFQQLPTDGHCYFETALFDAVIRLLSRHLRCTRSRMRCMEHGGGQGFFADAFRRYFDRSETIVSDLSLPALERASGRHLRIRCDARRQVLAPESVDLGVFWVSLHHLGQVGGASAIESAATSLRPGGLLLLFEPSSAFVPRRLLLRSPLRRGIYFDDAEQPLDLSSTQQTLRDQRLKIVELVGCNPPYNPSFLSRLRLGPLARPVVEALYRLDRLRELGRDSRAGIPSTTKPWYSYALLLARRVT